MTGTNDAECCLKQRANELTNVVFQEEKKERTHCLINKTKFRTMGNENNDILPSKAGLLECVLPGTGAFEEKILPLLQNSYMYPESVRCFRYSTSYLIKNKGLLEKYHTSCREKKDRGYKDEELEESFGFLLCDSEDKAKLLSETGLQVGHSTCSTLGDPSKGVYISKYSDCLHFNPWYHGKSGYIAIFRLIKGRVKAMAENYTQNFTQPSADYDCHISEHINTVSSTTSSFQAYERTQYYLYELQKGAAASCPRHVCPFAIVGFSYGESKPTTSKVLAEKSGSSDKPVSHYFPWKGQIQTSDNSLVYHVSLQSSSAIIPAKLPERLKVDNVMTVSDLKTALPRSVFETSFASEVFSDGVYCSLYDVVPVSEEYCPLHLMIEELIEKDLVFILPLNDSGFLILLPSSCFLTYEESASEKEDTLKALFIFPHSTAVQKDTKCQKSELPISSEVMQVLPGLNYAVMVAEKFQSDHKGSPSSLVEQHLHNYVTLTQPGISDSPLKEAIVLTEQYDVSRVYKHLYTTAKCPKTTISQLESYLSKPDTYILPVSKAVELLAVNQDDSVAEDAEDDCENVYYTLSSPETLHPEFWSDGDSIGETRSMEFKEGVPTEPTASADVVEYKTKKQEAMERFTEGVVALESNGKKSNMVSFASQTNQTLNTPTKPISGDMPTDCVMDVPGKREDLANANEQVNVTEGKTPTMPTPGVKVVGNCSDAHDQRDDLLLRDRFLVPDTQRGNSPTPTPSSERITRSSSKRTLNTADQSIIENDPKENAADCEPHTPKRKIKCDNSYGLKNIITDCGKIFIPHGSSFLMGDLKSLMQASKPSVEVSTGCSEEEMVTCVADSTQLTGMASADSGKIGYAGGSSEPGENKVSEVKGDSLIECIKDKEVVEALKTNSKANACAGKGKRKKPLSPLSQKASTVDPKETTVVGKPGPQKKKRKRNINVEEELENVSLNNGNPVASTDTNVRHSDSRVAEQTSKLEECAKPKIRQRKKTAKALDLSKLVVTTEDALQTPKSMTPQSIQEVKQQKIVKPFKKRMKNRIPECMKENGAPPLVSTDRTESTRSHTPKEDDGVLGRRAFQFRYKEAHCQEKNGQVASVSDTPQGFLGGPSACHPRLLTEENGVLQVTRVWKEKYEFNLDSKYTNDPLDKTISRALHGPWDFSIEETLEQVHLILHMWIGLFYSRSTMRFFQTDLDVPESSEQPSSAPKSSLDRDPSQNILPASCGQEQITFQIPPSVIQTVSHQPQTELLDVTEKSKKALNCPLARDGAINLSESLSEALDLSIAKCTRELLPCVPNDPEQPVAPERSGKAQSRFKDVINDSQLSQISIMGTDNHFVDKDCRAIVDMMSDDAYGANGDNNPDTSTLLEMDTTYDELCNRIAALSIAKGKRVNGIHRVFFAEKTTTELTTAHIHNPQTETRDIIQKTKTMYVQPAKLTFIALSSADASPHNQRDAWPETKKPSDAPESSSAEEDEFIREASEAMESTDNDRTTEDRLCGEHEGEVTVKQPEVGLLQRGNNEERNETCRSPEKRTEDAAEVTSTETDLLTDQTDHYEDDEEAAEKERVPLDLSYDANVYARVQKTADIRDLDCVGQAHETETPMTFADIEGGDQESARGQEEHTGADCSHFPSTVTLYDCWGKQKFCANYPVVKPIPIVPSRTIRNTTREDCCIQSFWEKWKELHVTKPDLTQASLDMEYLIFSEKMKHILKKNKGFRRSSQKSWSSSSSENASGISPIMVRFSSLEDVPDNACNTVLPLVCQKVKVDMLQGENVEEAESTRKISLSSQQPLRLTKLSYVNGIEGQHTDISDIASKCAKSYASIIDGVCSGADILKQSMAERQKRDMDLLHNTSKTIDFFHNLKHDMYDYLQNNLNSVVRQSFKTKFCFYIIETQVDAFFKNTKEMLKAEGHVEVQPAQFDQLDQCPSSPLLIIIRNKDILAHVCKIPHLLELKKMPNVLFAGVDCPDDVVNFTYQELFTRGGFVVCDGAVLETLTLDNVKKLVNFLEELSQNGKWKWFLHYKDSRRLKENGRTNIDAHSKKHLIDCCHEAGIVEVLPYHECDCLSQERPDYFSCLLRLQVQHVTARFAVFITDEPENDFGNNGVLAMNMNMFFYVFQRVTT
ncbi:uncharacterized protein tasor2 isoform X2 [Amia ocellicauda]|uniref:uncharacterized protein tasor2 isoform X2 n=1 Tax=Amia ocellicauda TaxID=2972642 RepID=UPI0034641CC1